MLDTLILCTMVQLPVQQVTDSTTDTVVTLADLNGDNDYNDAGEVVQLYADTIGSFALTNNIGLRYAGDGAAFLTDSGEDCVFALRDFNGDGDANDPDEHVRWFDGRVGGNAGGILMPSANGLVKGADGWWYVACANSGTTGVDSILRLRDNDGDGDANDLGEASEWWSRPGSPTGDYIPQAVVQGQDGAIYLTDTPSSAGFSKGVYRIVDSNADGDANDAGETAPFFIPSFTVAPFFWCLETDANGWFYTADTGNERVWRFKDLNADNDAMDAGESGIYWAVGAASNIWDLSIGADGSVYCSDNQTTSRIIRLVDANANGVIEVGETTTVYDETLASIVIGNGRGIDMVGAPAAGSAFCFGDGLGLPCPCATSGNPGKGCPNSVAPGGARLATYGQASVSADTLALEGRFMANSSALYFQGTSQLGAGLGTVFGDGLRCAGGSVIRLGTKINAAGLSRFPASGDPSVSVRGACAPGATHTYQVWYRNADPAYCTVSTFNLTNGVQVVWNP